MKYKVKLADGTSQFIQITTGYFKSLRVWNVRVNGKVAMLYKLGSEWMQRYEDQLDLLTLQAIGNYIDNLIQLPPNNSEMSID